MTLDLDLPDDIRDLSPAAKLCYLALPADDHVAQCDLAAELGCSRKGIYSAMGDLIAAGHAAEVVVTEDQRRTYYTLVQQG